MTSRLAVIRIVAERFLVIPCTNPHLYEEGIRLRLRCDEVISGRGALSELPNTSMQPPNGVDSGGTLSVALIGPVSFVNLGSSVFAIGFPNVEIQGIAPKLTGGEINSHDGIATIVDQWSCVSGQRSCAEA
jgi:hypothetical protein